MSYADEVLADSPVRWLKLDETSGTVADDATDNADGTYAFSPTLGVGALIPDGGSAVSTNKTAFQEITLPISIASQAAFALEFWMGWTGTLYGGNNDAIPVRDATSTGGTFPLFASDSTTLQFRVAGTTITVPGVVPNDYRDGATHHFVLTRAAGASPTGILYVDGVAVASGTVGTGAISSPFHFGKAGNIGQWSDCTFDHIAVYATELSAARVLAHYRTGFSPVVAPDYRLFPKPKLRR